MRNIEHAKMVRSAELVDGFASHQLCWHTPCSLSVDLNIAQQTSLEFDPKEIHVVKLNEAAVTITIPKTAKPA